MGRRCFRWRRQQDRFRIKSWFGSPGNVIYDNMMGATDGADPTTVLGGGSIQINKNK